MVNLFKQDRFLFWVNWLFYSSVVFSLVGVFLAFFNNSVFLARYDLMLSLALWQDEKMPDNVKMFRSFISGPFGGTIACCYILLAYIAYYPFRQKQIWARNAIVIAFSVWVVIDSVVCFRFGVYPQIYVLNAFSILVKALPVIFTWKDFKDTAN